MFFKNQVILFVIISIQLGAGQVGDSCLVNDEDGVCTEVISCDVAVRIILSKGNHQLPRCGFVETMEVVCCPLKKSNPDPAPSGRSLASRGGGDTRRRAVEECDKIKEQFIAPTKTYIIGGINAQEGEFPHMAALGYKMEDDTYSFVCGGSLISDTYILTAGHCISNHQGYVPSIARLGTLNISNPEFDDNTDYMINSTIVHPQYKRPKKYHDIALIRLSKPVIMSDQVYPACVNTKRLDPNAELYVSGWGKTNVTSSRTSNFLLKGKVRLVPRYICNSKHRISRVLRKGIIDEQICAMDESRNVDACQGDSGGPLQYYSSVDSYIKLVGVTSFGKGCATEVPGVYTRIFKYLDWIESIVWP